MGRIANLSLLLGAIPLLVLASLIAGIGNSVPTELFAAPILLCPPAAALFGHCAKRLGKLGDAPSLSARVRADVGIAVGYLELLVLVLLFFAFPYHGHPMAANESSAVGSLRSLQDAASHYAEMHPEAPIATDLRTLVEVAPRPNGRWKVDPVLAKGEKSGYRFIYIPEDWNENGRIQRYKIYADPIKPYETGVRHFFTDETGVIRYGLESTANSASSALE